MKIIEIYENDTLKVDDSETAELIAIKRKEPNLPFCIKDGKFISDAYIIGEIQLSESIIKISPRHDALTLSSFFEMLLYINNLDDSFSKSSNYSYQSGFGVDALLENFVGYCENLVSFGLTGSFTKITSNSHKPKGKILFNNYKKQLTPIHGLDVEQERYELNNPANQILKSALNKINSYKSIDKKISFRIKSLLNNFEEIGLYELNKDTIRNDIENYFSANLHYPICLEYASKILLDFKLGYHSNSDFQWNTFLENSNDTFEKYVRTILERELDNQVFKWDTPKPFAQFKWKGEIGVKSYTPDILIDYKNGMARAVFDAKNKHFAPSSENINDLVSVSDIYQLDFYAKQLESTVCGLIYPAKTSIIPIELEVRSSNQKFFLISIDMSLEFKSRISTFVNDIKNCLIYT